MRARGGYFSEETTAAAAFVAGEVDVDVMILAVDGFLYEWLFKDFTVYGNGIVVDDLDIRHRRRFVQIDTQLFK